jgi:hypothetical protein
MSENISQVMIQEPLFYTGGFSIPQSPKDVEMKVISAQLASSLNKNWHSRLPEIHWSNIL